METCYIIAQIGIIPLAIFSVVLIFIDEPSLERKRLHQDEKLLLVQVLVANGEQETNAFLPQTPSDSDIYWLNESSVLSLQGQKQLYKLGSTLRYMYTYYLQKRKFHHALVHSTTGNLNILQTSLQCLHAGLFPTFAGSHIISINIDWRPIPYVTLPTNEDIYICQQQLLADIKQIKVDDSRSELQPTLESIRDILKYNATLSDMVMLNDYLSYESLFQELPQQWTDIWPNGSQALVDHFWDQFANKTQVYAVPLLNLFLKYINAKIGGRLPPERKLHIFAGHRLNIATILSVLGGWSSKNDSIPTASYILMEFVQEIETNFYNIYFYYGKGNNMENPIPFKPRECANKICTIYEFTKLVNGLTLE